MNYETRYSSFLNLILDYRIIINKINFGSNHLFGTSYSDIILYNLDGHYFNLPNFKYEISVQDYISSYEQVPNYLDYFDVIPPFAYVITLFVRENNSILEKYSNNRSFI